VLTSAQQPQKSPQVVHPVTTDVSRRRAVIERLNFLLLGICSLLCPSCPPSDTLTTSLKQYKRDQDIIMETNKHTGSRDKPGLPMCFSSFTSWHLQATIWPIEINLREEKIHRGVLRVFALRIHLAFLGFLNSTWDYPFRNCGCLNYLRKCGSSGPSSLEATV
jgi:hypothetical protein